MGRKLRGFVGGLKDKVSITKASLLSSPSPTTATATAISPHLAVLRATTHHPSPPHPHHIDTLLSFGSSSRLTASSLVSALSARLLSTADPSVALKSLLSIHHLLSRGSFILLDTLSSSLLPSSGRRNPLNLSSFRNLSSPESFSLSSWVRWYARLLELLLPLSTNFFQRGKLRRVDDILATLLNRDLIAELDELVGVVEEMNRAPDALSAEKNRLVMEVVGMVEESRVMVQHEMLLRFREVKERLSQLGFADSVELVCLVRRMEECKGMRWKDWEVVREVRERVGEVVMRREEEERGRGRVRREKGGSESARVGGRVGVGSDQFGSTRWLIAG